VAVQEQGRFDERFWWRLQAAPYVGPDGAPLPEAAVEPVVVALAVGWNDGGRERQYNVTSLFLSRRPAAAAEAR
jgi:hypothetical protein